jgi:hypothetical protein
MHLCREYCGQCLNAVNIYIHSKTLTVQICVTVQVCVTEADWDFSRRTDLILPQTEHRKTVILSILKVDMYLLTLRLLMSYIYIYI